MRIYLAEYHLFTVFSNGHNAHKITFYLLLLCSVTIGQLQDRARNQWRYYNSTFINFQNFILNWRITISCVLLDIL